MLIKINTLKKNNKYIDKKAYLFEFLKEKECQLSLKCQIYFIIIKLIFSIGDLYHKNMSEIFSVIVGRFKFIIYELIKNLEINKRIILCYIEKAFKAFYSYAFKLQISK